MRAVYILGASHSGSTLLALLLGAQPEVCTIGEMKLTHLGDAKGYRCSCGQLIQQCAFWSRVRASMRARGYLDFAPDHAGTSFDSVESPYLRRLLAPLPRSVGWEWMRDIALGVSPSWHRHLAETQQRNAALVQVLQEISGAKVVLDSSKHPLRLKYLLRNRQLEVQVLRLIRDGRAVALTYTDEWKYADATEASLRGGGSGARRPPVHASMAGAAKEWRRSNEAADCMVEQLPSEQWKEVRYEALCADPASTLASVLGFLGLSNTAPKLDFRSVEQHVVGNGMRLDATSEVRLDERWRQELTVEDLRIFEAEAGALNRRYGYG